MNEENINRVIVLNKDGSYGNSFNINKTIKFGSAHPSNIRIKSSSVAPEHAIIQVNSDNNCSFLHISESNPPKINNVKCGKEPIPLNNGDIISMGKRSFIFLTDGTAESKKHSSVNESLLSESDLSQATTEPSSEVHSPEYGYLYICNRDGTERLPFLIKCDVVFGSESPASIRIRSSSIQPIHAKIVVHDIHDKTCFKLIPLTPSNPPTVNGHPIPYSQDPEQNSGVFLANNDEIGMGGRRFKFRTFSTKRDDDIMSVGSFSENDESPGRYSMTSEDDRDSLISEKIREKKQSEYTTTEQWNKPQISVNTSQPFIPSSTSQSSATTSTTETQPTNTSTDDSPTLKPPPRPPTPPAIRFKTLALMGATLTTTKSTGQFSSLTQSSSSSERREQQKTRNDRSTPPLSTSSTIRSTNLLFNRGEPVDVSGSDCDSSEPFNQIKNNPQPILVKSHSKESSDEQTTTTIDHSKTPPRIIKPTSAHFISPPSPFPIPKLTTEDAKRAEEEEDDQSLRYESLLSNPPPSPKHETEIEKEELKPTVPQQEEENEEKQEIEKETEEEPKEEIEQEETRQSPSLQLDMNDLPVVFGLRRQDTLLYDEEEEPSNYSPSLNSFPNSPMTRLSPPPQPPQIKLTATRPITPPPPTTTTETESSTQLQPNNTTIVIDPQHLPSPPISPFPSPPSPSPSPVQPVSEIQPEIVNSESEEIEPETITPPPVQPAQQTIPPEIVSTTTTTTTTQSLPQLSSPPIPTRQNVISLDNQSTLNSTSQSNFNTNERPHVRSPSPPLRPSLINKLSSAVTSFSSILIRPLFSLVHVFNPSHPLIPNNHPDLISDIEQNLEESSSDNLTPNENDSLNENQSEALIRYEGLKLLLNYNLIVFRHIYGTVRGFFYR